MLESSPRPDPLPAPAGHLTVRPDGLRPEEFLFAHQEQRLGGALGVSVATHVVMLLLGLLIVRMVPEVTEEASLPDRLPNEIVWLSEKGPGGGGGGGGNRMKEPPRKAEAPGKDRITLPAAAPAAPAVVEKPQEVPPLETLTIPAKTMAAGTTTAPGVLESSGASNSVSQGSGSGGGAGTGTGSGIGSGQGSGLGAGYGGGTGGGAYQPGNGVETPRLLRDVKPQYTAEAMRAKIQGVVLLECIVMPDGSVGEVKVKRSLDPVFGLDQEAVRAAKQWRFAPGTRQGQPVPVVVSIELSFSLR